MDWTIYRLSVQVMLKRDSIPSFYLCPGKLKLINVYNELSSVQWKSYKLGIQLGIPEHKLKEFQNEEDPLATALTFWLAGNVEDVPVSWWTIVKSLRNLKETRLADHVEKTYCQQEGNRGILSN